MNYKILSKLIKTICIPCVYIMSYYCFSKTNLFTLLNSLFSSDNQAFLIITFFVALVFLLINIIKGHADGFIFLVCTLFCLAAAAGYSKMNWISTLIYYIIHLNITFQTFIPAEKVTIICVLVVSGCIVIWFAARWEKEFDALISGGISKDETAQVFNGQTAYFLSALITALFLTAAFYMVLIYFEEFFKKAAVSIDISPAFITLAGIIPFIALLYMYLSKDRA